MECDKTKYFWDDIGLGRHEKIKLMLSTMCNVCEYGISAAFATVPKTECKILGS